jgi:hypothetical protein
MHAVLTHRLFWLAESAPLRDFLRVAFEADADGPVCTVVLGCGSSMVLLSKRIPGNGGVRKSSKRQRSG